MELVLSKWVDSDNMVDILQGLPKKLANFGDVYVRTADDKR